MPATAASRTTVRPGPHCFGRAPASVPATTAAYAAAPGRSTFRVIDDGAICRVTGNLLIIDKDMALMPEWLRQAFPPPAHRVQFAASGAEGLRQVRIDPPDVILLDPRLPDESGLGVYEEIRRIDAHIPVIFVTMAKTADSAIEAMKQGAYDYLFKPLDPHELRRVVGAALEVARRMRQPAAVAETSPDPDVDGAMVGSCPAMCEVYKAIGRVAAQNVPVLITGESGTGKELVARAIHQHGPRAQAPFLALNCAAIPEQLLESELFGHEKGAFTGADRRRIGKFEQCHGGTLFLDEIGDMPLALQAKMLRLLQEQSFERIGGNETIKTDVRLIAATHRDLTAWSAEGKFRPDLYYRLGVFTIHLPPLRERGDDLPMLVQHYLRRISRELGREIREIAPEALERLRNHPWPGNIRELQSALKRALLQASGTILLTAFLPELTRGESRGARGEKDAESSLGPRPSALAPPDLSLEAFIRERLVPDGSDLYAETHRQVDRLMLLRVLEFTGGNQYQAARLLGIARQTLRVKLRDLGMTVSHSVEADEED
jgi:DNA-binding NtrC family response regulator